MSKLTRDQFDEFLATYRFVHVGTLNEDGSPYAVPAVFFYTGSAMLIAARGRSQWYANIVRDPRVSLCIDETVGIFRRIVVSKVKADILFEPGHEKEWIDTKRTIEIKGLSDQATENYLLNVSKIPYALLSIPFEFDSKNVATWCVSITDTDQSGLMSKRYGEIVSTNLRAENFLQDRNS
jgi:hypothetical protein